MRAKRGNMTIDKNKGINTAISYNYLNLPESITHSPGTTEYVYNATGVKLSHKLGNDVTEYIGNFVYENGSLKYILTSEGKINHNAGVFAYEYFLKDHLGNTRVTYKQNGEVVQTADYYPFGMRHEPMALEDASQKYLYNGKELQKELDWYDYGFRQYDPAIARFTTIDPLTVKNNSQSGFVYAANNPIRFIDYMGLDTLLVDKKGRFAEESIKGGDNDVIVKVSNRERRKGEINHKKDHEVSEDFELGSITATSEKTELSGKVTTVTTTNNDESEGIFNFLADNTKVEYSHLEMSDSDGNQTNFITTSHDKSTDLYGSELLYNKAKEGGNTLTSHTHNHPNTPNPTPSDYEFYQTVETIYGPQVKFYIRYKETKPVPAK